MKVIFLDIGSNIEIDHKDGRKDDSNIIGLENQRVGDFQATSKSVNDAKRQHCKECKKTNKRYNAKRLGYSVSQYIGPSTYEGSCVGCYWHDPFEFNKNVSKSYIKPYSLDGMPVVEVKTTKTDEVCLRIPLFVLVSIKAINNVETIEKLKDLKIKESVSVINNNNVKMKIKRVE